MRNLRTVVPALLAACAVGVGGTAFALAGAAPATSAAAPATVLTASGPVADLLAGSYQPTFGRLSVAGKTKITNRRPPVVSGKAVVGRKVSVSPGSWKPATVSVSYTWYAGSKKIKGVSGPSYSPTESVAGSVLRVRVTASKQGYRPATFDTGAGLVKGGTLSVVSEPVVRGTAKVGEKLRVTPGQWSASEVSVSYAWLKGRKVVSTSSRYTVQRSDRGERLRVEVTATRSGYRAGTVLTELTDRVRG